MRHSKELDKLFTIELLVVICILSLGLLDWLIG
jgi:hypothetical protein